MIRDTRARVVRVYVRLYEKGCDACVVGARG